MTYGPCDVEAKVAGGVKVSVHETTLYPFDESIHFTIVASDLVRFPLFLRIPAWCHGAKISINDHEEPTDLPAGQIARVERVWKPGDSMVLGLPMNVRVRIWKENRGFASIDRGPLTYSLAIKEDYVRHGGNDKWPGWDILPNSPWNYGLVLGKGDPAAGISVKTRGWTPDRSPFAADDVPLELTARARRIPNWGLDPRGLVQEVIQSPVRSSEPEETVKLVPMGAARLRISAFPVVGDGPDARDWPK